MIWWLIFINFFAWCDDRTLLIAFILLYNETMCLFDQFCYIIQLLHILSIDFILFTIIMYSSYGSLHIMNAIAIATWLAWIMIVKRNKIILKLKLYFYYLLTMIGLVSFFDFIVSAKGIPLATLDSTFVDLIKVSWILLCISAFLK